MRWPSLIVATFVLLFAHSVKALGEDGPWATPPPAAKKVSLHAREVPLDKVVQRLAASAGGIRIVVHREFYLSQVKVTAACQDLPLGEVLDALMPRYLSWVCDGHTISVLPGELAWKRQLTSHAHKLSPASRDALVRWRKRCQFWATEPGYEEWAELITRVVGSDDRGSVAAWRNEGGVAGVEGRDTHLVVKQTPEGHRRIRRLLRMLDAGFAGRTPEPSQRDLSTEKTIRLLERGKVTLNVSGVPLTEALGRVAKACPGLNLVLRPSLADPPIQVANRRVTLDVKDVPVGLALDLMLGEDMTYRVEGKLVVLVAAHSRDSGFATRVYPLQPLLEGARFPSSRREQFVDLILRHVSHLADPRTAWWMATSGGPATIDEFGPLVVVRQTHAGHRGVGVLLRKIEAALAGRKAPLPAREKQMQNLRKGLDQKLPRITGTEGMDVIVAVELLADLCPDLHLTLSPEARNNLASRTDRTVDLDLKDTTFREALGQVLGPKLTPCIEEGAVVVRMRNEARRALLTRCYRVGTILRRAGRGIDVEQLLDIIERNVANLVYRDVAAWQQTEGGPARIDWVDEVIVVSQTPEGHRRVANLLQKMEDGIGSPE